MIKEKIEKIMDIVNEIEYGFKDEYGNNIIYNDPKMWNNEFDSFYYLQSPEELLKTKCGVCWDQVELERKLFANNNIIVKTFFIYISDDDMLPSHTFVSYKNDNKYYWFEHSWDKYKGIHEYNSELDLLLDIMSKFREDHTEVSKKAPLHLYEYQRPKDHIKCNEFYKYIETQNKIEFN